MYLSDTALQTSYRASEGSDIGKKINEAMDSIENQNEDLKGVLPRQYNKLDNTLLFELLKNFNGIPLDSAGDVFGKIYEYFLGKFAMSRREEVVESFLHRDQ